MAMFIYPNITKDNYTDSSNRHVLQRISDVVDICVESDAPTGKLILQKTLEIDCDCWFDIGDELEINHTGSLTGATPLIGGAVRIKPLDDGVSWTMYINEFKNNQLSPY